MNLRWLWFDHIPPELEVPKEARNAIKRRAQALAWERLPHFRVYPPAWRVAAAVIGGLTVVTAWLIWRLPLGLDWMVILWFVLGVSLIPVVGSWIAFATSTGGVRLALCQLGYLCCVKCGYPHIGLSKDVKECPECGTPREFGRCTHCKAEQDWPMQPNDRCTKCGRKRLS